ncbi:LysR family transcriptional regulator, partial [Klebsiella pneumoniae]|uniref:LysR family transcriptional regulator n=1 Tax=Klebsiella pneumoniae TaxID=573 RepID=UPI002164B731
RSRRGTRLSPAGAALLPAVRQFADQLSQLGRTVDEIAAGHSAVLNIGAITSAMLETLPPLLEELKRATPGLTIFIREIDSVDAIPALENGELDLAFVRLEGETEGHITTLPLEESRLAVALPVDHPLALQQ